MELSLDKVKEILEGRGIEASVEQTGGGVATLYAGGIDAEGRGRVLVGPGSFEGPGWTNAKIDTEECYVGPDDDGETQATEAEADWDEARLAQEVENWLARLEGTDPDAAYATPEAAFEQAFANLVMERYPNRAAPTSPAERMINALYEALGDRSHPDHAEALKALHDGIRFNISRWASTFVKRRERAAKRAAS